MKLTSIFKEYIEKELMTSAPDLDKETRAKLENIASAFLQNQITMITALAAFSECSCTPSIITKLAHIKSVGDQPLPPPSFNKLSLILNTRKKGLSWSTDEDMRLLTAVSKYGSHDWVMISAFVGGGRTSSQCNQRWTRALNPSISRNPWTQEEDMQLMKIVEEMGEGGWRKIAQRLDGRTDLQCRHRYLQMKKKKSMENVDKKRIVLPSLTDVNKYLENNQYYYQIDTLPKLSNKYLFPFVMSEIEQKSKK